MRSFPSALRNRRLLLLLLLPLAACTTPRAGGYESAQADKWEGTNRKIFLFNKRLDRAVLKPASTVYRTAVPAAARKGISNAYGLYGEPGNIMNAILQGKIKQAFRSVDRMLLNATLGVGGLGDVATELGRPEEQEDFGQTFATWGIKSGPYVVLPLFGPSTLRDSFGLAFDFALEPSDYIRNATTHPSLYFKGGQITTRLINFRSNATDLGADGIMADSLDEYALLKSVYIQNRRNAIYDGNPPPTADELDDGSEPFMAAPAAAPPATPAEPTPPPK